MERNGILSGLKVLDLTRILAGPYCCMMLADMGADVIKIEMPQSGDDSRRFGPFVNGESAYFMNLNRNKRGMTLNLKSAEGKEIFLKLVEKCDMVVENYRPGTMEKLGLDYATLKARNPAIILGSISGFGQYGPYHERPGYDIIAQAMSGLMSTTGWPDGEPTRTSTAIGDVLGGLGCAIGLLAAYVRRLKTGEGERIDVSLVDSVVSGLEVINQIYLSSGRNPQRSGNRYESAYPYDSFKTANGSFVMSCANDKLFSKLCEIMNMPELEADERFCSNKNRVQNHAPMKRIIEDWLADKSADEMVEKLTEVGIPAAPILDIAQVTADPHIADAREMFVPVDHPVAGNMKITGNQIKLSQNPIQFERAAPTLGQHTAEILREYLDVSREELARLSAEGVL
ncbi:MAG: CoA transferase [Clostridia bacterium]|nr:CoA transferase [Clostridia bacterium]